MLRKTNKERGKRVCKRKKENIRKQCTISNIHKRKLNKKKLAVIIFLLLLTIIQIVKNKIANNSVETSTDKNIDNLNVAQTNIVDNSKVKKEKIIIDDWRLILANYANLLPEDFKVEVSNIDKTRQFDSRAIDELNDMMNAMKKEGITNIWIQSAYRSVERQKELYDNSVKKYLKQGKTQEEAEKLTEEYINKPGSSDHNLGLAVDFNYVDNKFEKLEGFKWLQKNAENYGFVLRYPKDKEGITQIAYESWHWRYVGVEHAKKMNELNMCLEEYIEYLKNNC